MKKWNAYPYSTQYAAAVGDGWRWDCSATSREAAVARAQALLAEGRVSARVLWDVTNVPDAEVHAVVRELAGREWFEVEPRLENRHYTCRSLDTARQYQLVREVLNIETRKVYLQVHIGQAEP